MDITKINILNFRDLGGYVSKDGRFIKNGLLFRGSALENITDEEKEFINSLNLKTIIDFRSDVEVNDGSLYIPNHCNYYRHSFIDQNKNQINLDVFHSDNQNKLSSWLKELYRMLPHNNQAYKILFKSLVDEEYPLYFHCSAGKDRTGVAAALIMTLLDIDEKDIFKEYLISSKNLIKHFENSGGIPETYLVDENWLLATFEEIDKRYVNKEEYFFKEFGIDEKIKNELKDKLLQRGIV